MSLKHKHTHIILPFLLSLPPLPLQLCSIIVFGCIADKVIVNDVCFYNNSNACNFGIAVGVIGFVMCLVFLVKDVLYVVIDFSNNLLVS